MSDLKPHSGRSEKRTYEFVGDIKAMIKNPLIKSISFIACDMIVFDFLIRQVIHEYVRYFSFKIRKS